MSEEDMRTVEISLDQPKINLGVPLIIVGCKADYYNQRPAYDDKFVFLARRLRKICIDYGATLVFTSAARKGVNVEVIQDYIFHRAYGFKTDHKEKVIGSCNEDDFNVYIPAGLDNMQLLDTYQANSAGGMETPFEDVFIEKQGALGKAKQDIEIKAEDNNLFFKTLSFNQNERGPPSRTPIIATSSLASPQTGSSISTSTTGVGASANPTANPRTKPTPNEKKNQTVKAFFKQLLIGPAGTPNARAAEVRNDAQQVLAMGDTAGSAAGPAMEFPADLKKLLCGGTTFSRHNEEGDPKQRVVQITEDLKLLTWRDPRAAVADESRRMQMSKVHKVEKGYCTKELSRKRSNGQFFAKEDCAFAIFESSNGRDAALSLEASSQVERDQWVAALIQLIQYHKSIRAVSTTPKV